MNQSNFKGALLVMGGIVIGIALTAIFMNTFNKPASEDHKLVAASTGHHAPQQPSGAVAAETHHALQPVATHPMQTTPQAAPIQTSATVPVQTAGAGSPPVVAPNLTPVAEEKHPHDWVTPADLAKQTAAKTGTSTAPASAGPQYKSSHQTYYVYGGDGSIPGPSALPTAVSNTVSTGVPGQTMTVETNYVYTNCVDPPSVTRGRAYRPPVH